MDYLHISVPPYPYFVLAGSALYRPGDSHRRRRAIGVFDLIFVRYGELFLTESGRTYHLKENDILFLDPQGTHYSHHPVTMKTLFYWTHFRVDGEYAFTDHISYEQKPDKKAFSFYWAPKDSIFLPVHKRLAQEERQGVLALMSSLSTLSIDKYQQNTLKLSGGARSSLHSQELFCQLLRLLQIQPLQSKDSNRLALDVMNYLMQNYYRQVNLEQLGEHFSFHPAHLIRCMKKEFGVTPIEALNQIRIDNARRLLVDGTMSNQEIASAVGISTPSYFNKLFKKHTGMTPKQYYQAQKQGAAHRGE